MSNITHTYCNYKTTNFKSIRNKESGLQLWFWNTFHHIQNTSRKLHNLESKIWCINKQFRRCLTVSDLKTQFVIVIHIHSHETMRFLCNCVHCLWIVILNTYWKNVNSIICLGQLKICFQKFLTINTFCWELLCGSVYDLRNL